MTRTEFIRTRLRRLDQGDWCLFTVEDLWCRDLAHARSEVAATGARLFGRWWLSTRIEAGMVRAIRRKPLPCA